MIQLPTMDSMSSTAPPSPMVFDISSTPRMFPLGESGTGTIGSLTERSGGTTDDQVSGLGTLPALSTTGADIVDNKGGTQQGTIVSRMRERMHRTYKGTHTVNTYNRVLYY